MNEKTASNTQSQTTGKHSLDSHITEHAGEPKRHSQLIRHALLTAGLTTGVLIAATLPVKANEETPTSSNKAPLSGESSSAKAYLAASMTPAQSLRETLPAEPGIQPSAQIVHPSIRLAHSTHEDVHHDFRYHMDRAHIDTTGHTDTANHHVDWMPHGDVVHVFSDSIHADLGIGHYDSGRTHNDRGHGDVFQHADTKVNNTTT